MQGEGNGPGGCQNTGCIAMECLVMSTTRLTITVESNPDPAHLESLGVLSWPTWSKEASEFPWSYDSKETCYFLEGDVVVTPDGGEPVKMGKGDFVTFPAGMSCTWKILADVNKHYQFS